MHFLLCEKFDDTRHIYLNKFSSITSDFKELNDKSKLIKAASSDERVLAVHACLGMLLLMHAAAGLVNATPSVEDVFPVIWWAAPPAGINNVC